MDLFARTCNTERMNAERIIARLFVIGGGMMWALMLFASNTAARYTNFTYSFDEVVSAGFSAAIPFVLTIIVFAVGLFYERLAAVILIAASVATIAWGFIADWGEPVLWVNAMLVLVAPMVVAAALFLLAARMQQVCTLESK
jgi:hypothetical protein